MATEIETTQPKPDAGTELLQQYKMAVDPESQPAAEETAAPATSNQSPPPAAQPTAPKHPSYLTRLAKQNGLDDAEIQALSADDLKEAIILSGQRKAEHQEAQRSVRQRDPQTGRFLPVAGEAQNEPSPAPAEEKPFSLAEIGVDPAKWTENTTFADALTEVLGAVHKKYEAKFRQLEGGLTEFDRREQARHAQAAGDKLDQMFQSHESVFGKGTRHKLAKDSPEFVRRSMVVQAMKANFEADPQLSFEENFERASKAFVGLAAASQPVPSAPVDDKNFRNGATLLPTARRFAEMKPGIKKAEMAVDEFLRTMDEEEVVQKPVLPK